jgi:hypothetical protein
MGPLSPTSSSVYREIDSYRNSSGLCVPSAAFYAVPDRYSSSVTSRHDAHHRRLPSSKDYALLPTPSTSSMDYQCDSSRYVRDRHPYDSRSAISTSYYDRRRLKRSGSRHDDNDESLPSKRRILR